MDRRAVALGLLFSVVAGGAQAQSFIPDTRSGGKLLLTGGVSTIEGSGGGGIATWATVTGYGEEDGIGANAHVTFVALPDYRFRSAGIAVGLWDRVEVSAARQELDTGESGALLGLGEGFTFTQDVIGVKLRLTGDAVYDQDAWIPQIAVGAQHKRNDQGAVIAAIGGQDDQGTEFYVVASKLFLAQSVLVSGAVRVTNANQTGLLGFGGDTNDDRQGQFEGSIGWLLRRNVMVGAEYRTKPDNLSFASEEDWFDVYAAWAINKHLSLTLAWADLGSIATFDDQRGFYLSLQSGF